RARHREHHGADRPAPVDADEQRDARVAEEHEPVDATRDGHEVGPTDRAHDERRDEQRPGDRLRDRDDAEQQLRGHARVSVDWSTLVKKVSPSTPERIAAAVSGPKPGSTACSGCGMSPTTLPRELVRPAMSLSEPFGLSPVYR